MSLSWLEILGFFILIVVGIIYLTRIIYNYKIGKKIWKVYTEIAEEIDLEVKKSLNVLSSWPNLFGELRGKRTYVHPDRGSRKSPAKTIFAVENKMELPSDLIINKSDVDQPKDSHELGIQSINEHDLNIYTNAKIDEDEVDDLFTGEVGDKINELIQNNPEDFRAVIFESGLAMFSKFKIDLDKDSVSNDIDEFTEIVKDMEKSTSLLNEDLDSPRMRKISKGTKSTHIKAIIPLIFFGISGYLIYRTAQNFSLLFLTAAAVLATIGGAKLFVALHNEWKYQ